MSSVDLHTHSSAQHLTSEYFAVVVAPTDKALPFGMFRLCEPDGLAEVYTCRQTGFHHHNPGRGTKAKAIYEQAEHVDLVSDEYSVKELWNRSAVVRANASRSEAEVHILEMAK